MVESINLSEICTFKQCGGTPDIISPDYWDGEFPWLSSGETSSLFVYDTKEHITCQAVSDYKLKLIEKGSLVIARSGQGFTRGQVSMCMNDMYVNDGVIVIVPDTRVIDPFYLLYNLHSRYDEIRVLSDSNSCRGNLNAQILSEMTIDLPEISTQKKVAYLLKLFDKKIHFNNQINDNLLQLARLEYISFKNDNEYASKPLSKVASFNAKSINNKGSFKVINYLDTGSITSGIVTSYQQLDTEIDEIPSRAKRLVQPNDIIFSTVRPNQNHFGILTSIPDNCVVSTGFTTISSMSGSISNEMIYLEITSEAVVAAMQQIAETSTSAYPSIRPEDLGEVEVPIFSNSEKLMKTLSTIFQIIDSNQREIRSLDNLRDFLLPKLMSGEIDVSTLDIPTKYSFISR